MQRSIKDVLAGVTFVVFGVSFAAGATAYPVGNLARMGPGLYPLVVGVLLAALGAFIAVRPALDGEADTLTAPAWRGLAFTLGAVVLFALTVRGLGLIPAVFLSALLGSLASRRTGPLMAVSLAVALTVLSYLVFVVGLRLTSPLFGPWVPRL
jgi:hypothetical protein